MGALRQPNVSKQSPKKPPATETRKLDQYGRDPESLPEKLRTQTGYAPFYHAWNADIPRLLGPSAVARDLISQVNRLSLGRSRESKEPRYEWTLPISAAELAELCACNVRDIQRQLKELSERGIIGLKTVKNGSVKYVISLLYSKWQELENYSVWKRRQVVAIDKPEPDEESEADKDQMPISKDAVQLFKKPASVRPGRATRAAKVNVGVREVVCQNDSPTVDAAFSAVVQSGRLVVSATFQISESKAKGEDKGNAERHPCRALPANEGKVNTGQLLPHPRAEEILSLFEPLLRKSGARLLGPDTVALKSACAEVGDMPHDALVYFVMREGARGSRPISGPRVVASIIRECRQNWEAREREIAKARPAVRCKCGGEIMDVQSQLCARCLDAHTT
jgi:hypothetical protein